jgi:hypothetical protein
MVTTNHNPAGGTIDRNAMVTIVQLIAANGLKALVLLARAYLGPAAYSIKTDTITSEKSIGGLSSLELHVLGLAVAKLAFEAGELGLHNPAVAGDGAMPAWQLDERGRAPALSLAHVLAAPRLWSTPVAAPVIEATRATARAVRVAARTSYYAGASPAVATSSRAASSSRISEATRMISTSVSTSRPRTGGCGCGGTRTAPPPPATVYDPCAGGVKTAPPPRESHCSCGGSCGGRGCGCATPTRTYDAAQCPTVAISCETKERLRTCVKTALCDFARCVTDVLCPDGRFDSTVLRDKETTRELADCVGQLACSFLHCLPEALCPEECPPPCAPPPSPIDCLPCGYAVEVLR